MQVNSISNLLYSSKKITAANNSNVANSNANLENVSFSGDDKKKPSKAMRIARDAAIAAMFLSPVAGSMTSCEKLEGYAYAEAHAWAGIGHYVDSTQCTHPTDTLIKWWYDWDRPWPLDSLYNNLQNWDIDGTDGDKNDSLANRNIVHYEGTRDWEYGTREIGDMNVLESKKKILVYDTEFLDYKGNHESYGKRVLRLPSSNFTITKADGTVLHNPGGLFVEEYENEFDEKGGSILDCKLKTRAFVSTQGDTLNVARRKGTSEFVETGKVAKGYINPKNSILLKNLIGEYPTDDHYIDFKIEAINDKELRAKYVYAKDEVTE